MWYTKINAQWTSFWYLWTYERLKKLKLVKKEFCPEVVSKVYRVKTVESFRPDLVRPANSLYMHNLTGLLEAAIRATNAQFEHPDILKRLDCRLLEV